MSYRFEHITRVEGVFGGRPVLRGTGISAVVIAGRFAAGESIAELAADYRVQEAAVTDAIRLVVAATFGRKGMLAEIKWRAYDSVPLEAKR
jgi:uncharacterized protein (DUF433 family)